MKKVIGSLLVMTLVLSVSANSEVVLVDQGTVYHSAMTEATLEVALASAYVWRGQVHNNDAVIQPQITLAQYGFSMNMWANYDLGANKDQVQSDVSEFDISFAYSLPIDVNEMAIDVGLINYNYPDNGSTEGDSNPSTTEVFISGTILSFKDKFIPSITAYADIEEYPGVYVLFDLFVPYEVSEYVSLAGGFTAGYGNTSYNDEVWANGSGNFDAEFSDFSVYAVASYEVSDELTAAATLNYATLNGGSFEQAAAAAGYEADEKVWVSVNIAYDF
jgi:uncharacterized protein (TIGR02001 family)